MTRFPFRLSRLPSPLVAVAFLLPRSSSLVLLPGGSRSLTPAFESPPDSESIVARTMSSAENQATSSSRPVKETNNDKYPVVVDTRSRASSSSSRSLSLKVPRTPRFAEATAVHSPIEPSQVGRSPFADPPGTMTNHYRPEPQPSDVGFGYISEADPSRNASYPGMPVEEDCNASLAPKSPLKSALKVPGTPGRPTENPLSPTFKEEHMLEKHEAKTDKENARDLVSRLCGLSSSPIGKLTHVWDDVENQDPSAHG